MKLDLIKLKNEYLEYVKATLSDGTYRCYYYHLNSIVKYFIVNNIDVNKINLIKYIQDCKEKNLANKTINHRILTLKCMLRFSDIDSDIMKIKKLVVTNKPFDYLDNDKLKLLKEYIETSSIKNSSKLVLALLYETGVRLRELVNIEIKNINFKTRTILLTETKTKSIRYVFYTKFSEQYLLKEDLTKEMLFNQCEHGIYKIFVRANKKLGFNKFHPHMLRHTCATNLLKNGADLETVRQILGHTDIKQTQQYLHLDTDYIKSVYDKCML